MMIKQKEMEEDPRFLLKNITLYNWGPFSGMIPPAEIDEKGSAIIGATGSGKTSLIDALMTLLVAKPRYNFASTGGYDSNDRTEVSYVRGVQGMVSNTHEKLNVLRSGYTVTGIAADYSDGEKHFKIGGILWFENHSQATTDLKRLWYVIEDHEDDLRKMLELFNEGGKREIKKYAKEHNYLEVYDQKKAYLAKIRRFFEVGENAFTLLNRAAGLKQLNSINQIFRELVLDNEAQFKLAEKVANSFDNLEGIYQELLQTKKQIESLLPIKQDHNKCLKQESKIEQYQRFILAFPIWFAEQKMQLLEKKRKLTSEELQQHSLLKQQWEQAKENAQETLETQQKIYQQLGGNEIETYKQFILKDQEHLAPRLKKLNRYHRDCQLFNLGKITGLQDFEHQAIKIQHHLEQLEKENQSYQQQFIELNTIIQQQLNKQQEAQQELREVFSRPKSNIPAKFQLFRETLAAALNVNSETLPYMGEMVQVKPEEREWTGAIERALGSERLRLLIPADLFPDAKRWVNQRNNKLHIRLLDIGKATHNNQAKPIYADSFIHKLDIEHEEESYHLALMSILQGKDRHCVEDINLLDDQEFSLSKEGSMYDRAGRFEKQDQRSLNEHWMTGFDNTHIVQSLEEIVAQCNEQLTPLKAKNATLLKQNKINKEKEDSLRALKNIEFSEIDTFSLLDKISHYEQLLEELQKQSKDLEEAQKKVEETRDAIQQIENDISDLDQKIGSCKNELHQLQNEQLEAQKQINRGIEEDLRQHLLKQIKLKEPLELGNIERQKINIENETREQLEKIQTANTKTIANLSAKMAKAKSPEIDNGQLAEAGTTINDVDDYLNRLKHLERENLPKRRERFLHYLNKSSEQGVVQLLQKIQDEVYQIKERLEKLNATLGKVEYKKGRFLMLDASEINSDSLREVNKAEKKLATSRLQEDEEGELRYKALKNLIEIIRNYVTNSHTIAAQSLLDPRHRLDFCVREVERSTMKKSGKISGSQTGSGGEKEQMASYILTASLSYALCPRGATRPRYATIVLDEAFSKSSQSAATKIIQALREFGLHPLFVTPNKEMGLLKNNTASAILVQKAQLSSMSWKELDELQSNSE